MEHYSCEAGIEQAHLWDDIETKNDLVLKKLLDSVLYRAYRNGVLLREIREGHAAVIA